MATAYERNGRRVCRVIEAICNRATFTEADALFTPDYVNHGGLIPDLVRGPEAFKVAVALYRTAFPDFRVRVEPLRARRATVLLRWTAGPRPDGPPSGDPGAGARGGVAGLARVRLVDGLIAESWIRWDAAGALRHLGIVPAV